MTKAATAKTTTFWRGAIVELAQKRDAGDARIQQLTERRRSLSLDAQLDEANGPARKEIDRIARELFELTAGREELTSAIGQAEGQLTGAQATEAAALQQESQQRCRVIAARALKSAGAVDAAFQVLVAAGDTFKADILELALESKAEALSNTPLLRSIHFTAAARLHGLGRHVEMPPEFTSTHRKALSTAAAAYLNEWLQQEKEK